MINVTVSSYLAVLASEAGWTVALGLVLDGHALAPVLAEVAALAVHGPAVVLAGGPGGPGLLAALTLEALALPGERLEVVEGAGGAGRQASGGVVAGGALLSALVRLPGPGLECEHLLGTLGAGLVTLLGRLLGQNKMNDDELIRKFASCFCKFTLNLEGDSP